VNAEARGTSSGESGHFLDDLRATFARRASKTAILWHDRSLTPCLMLYSSGTTGRPKGVVHSHSNLASALRALIECWRFTPDDVLVNVLPLFHITNGFNVYPQVVERVINECPGVRESTVVGVPDRKRGERVAAAVVRSDETLSSKTLRTFLNERLVDYQRPSEVVFVAALPRNAMGKVMRRELREQLTPSDQTPSLS
jgi:acyl-CoA synthetase (AMP-forming)/AMP-acid ligase II